MERLILFRHGKAEAHAASGDDFDRPLAPRGQREAAAMAEDLARMGVRPDVALVSPAARTRETWEAASEALQAVVVQFPEGLYNADAGAIWRAAEAHPGTVMVVGHNPGLHELALRLMIAGTAGPSEMAQAQRRFPPATAAVFAIDADGRPSLDRLMYPEREG